VICSYTLEVSPETGEERPCTREGVYVSTRDPSFFACRECFEACKKEDVDLVQEFTEVAK
jgi:hypothetical protein